MPKLGGRCFEFGREGGDDRRHACSSGGDTRRARLPCAQWAHRRGPRSRIVGRATHGDLRRCPSDHGGAGLDGGHGTRCWACDRFAVGGDVSALWWRHASGALAAALRGDRVAVHRVRSSHWRGGRAVGLPGRGAPKTRRSVWGERFPARSALIMILAGAGSVRPLRRWLPPCAARFVGWRRTAPQRPPPSHAADPMAERGT